MSLRGKSILIISPDFPYPANHGGRVDILGRLKALHDLGFCIDLLVTVKEVPKQADIDYVRRYVNDLTVVQRVASLRHIFSMKPFQITSRSALARVRLKKAYDVALLETDYVASILDNITLQTKHLALRVQNDEIAYFRALANSADSVFKKIYFWSDSLKFYFFTPMLFRRVKNLLFISHDEYDRFSAMAAGQGIFNASFLPPPLGEQIHKYLATDSKRVLFLGSLFMPNNLSAIKWYLEHVHQALLDIPGYSFVIAGNMKGANESLINSFLKKYARVQLRENPEQLDPIYRECAVFVNPMHHGAGVKLKTINAIEAGIAVVSTSVGKEGTGFQAGKHLLVAESGSEFALAVRRLLMNPEDRKAMTVAAQSFLAANYDHKAQLRMYFERLLSI